MRASNIGKSFQRVVVMGRKDNLLIIFSTSGDRGLLPGLPGKCFPPCFSSHLFWALILRPGAVSSPPPSSGLTLFCNPTSWLSSHLSSCPQEPATTTLPYLVCVLPCGPQISLCPQQELPSADSSLQSSECWDAIPYPPAQLSSLTSSQVDIPYLGGIFP